MFKFNRVRSKMDQNTVKCISISEKPGAFGLTFHNQGYVALRLNQTYTPLKVLPKDLESTIQLVRDNFKGCSVSMPHKVEVMKYLDELDSSASRVGAVNTIVNNNGHLTGYNTDYYGAKNAILKSGISLGARHVLMIGAGGVARAIGCAVKDLEGNLTITNRTDEKAKALAKKMGANIMPYSDLPTASGHLLINATSVGMTNPDDCPVKEETIESFEAIMDVIVGNETKLIQEAEKHGKVTIPGKVMTTYQAAKQFELYTGKQLPEDFLEKFI